MGFPLLSASNRSATISPTADPTLVVPSPTFPVLSRPRTLYSVTHSPYSTDTYSPRNSFSPPYRLSPPSSAQTDNNDSPPTPAPVCTAPKNYQRTRPNPASH